LTLRSLKLVKSRFLVQMLIRKPSSPVSPYLEFHAQPLTHPMADMAVDLPVGLADMRGQSKRAII
jgi:hypothetical protein